MHNVTVLSTFGSHIKRLKDQIKCKYPGVLRMGSIEKFNTNGHVVLNTAESIYLCSDKIASKKLWLKHGIKTPGGYTIDIKEKEAKDGSEYFKYTVHDFNGYEMHFDTFCARQIVAKLTHRKAGRGMVLLENRHQIMSFLKLIREEIITDNYYYEDYLPYPHEFRLHICELGLIHAAEKENDKHYNSETWYSDNNSCEFHTVFSKPTCWPYIIEECQKTLKLLKLDVGGFDVKSNDKQFTIIECNSGPSISNASAEKYKYWIPKLIEHKYDQ